MQDIWISKLKKLLSSELSTTYELQIFAATLGFLKSCLRMFVVITVFLYWSDQ